MQSDEVISEIWLVLPLIGVIGGAVLQGIFWVTGGFWVTLIAGVVASIISVIFFAILNYKLFNRNNQHIKRETMMREGIIDYFRNKGAEKGISEKISVNLSTMDSINYEGKINDDEHNAALWAILPILPVVGWIFLLIALYYLTKFPADHDRRWHAFTQQVQNAGSHMGTKVILPSWKTLPERSYILYLILTIITFGLFGLYWYYVLIKDMNKHFQTQWRFEDQLIQEME